VFADPVLEVAGLRVAFPSDDGEVDVVRDVSLSVGRGEIVGLVGESGSGKTITALSVMRLVPPPGRIVAGRIVLDGIDLLALDESRMRRLRGSKVSMVFQEPTTALNPVFTIGFQLLEAIRVHRRLSRAEARAEALRLLDLVALPDAKSRLRDYPHQLSGGQRQRVVLAMALACGPDLLLADEPTTALDVTIQAQILELLERLRQDLGLAVLLITHDLAVVAESCDRVLVAYAGQIVEEAPVEELFRGPAHPYTRGLLAALPQLGKPLGRGHLRTIPGRPPEPGRLPGGCVFHPRCPEVMAHCRVEEPGAYRIGARHLANCFLHRPEGR
jgi:oligopeptide/dipeptide ABC transporter ATP-binding protein